MAESCYSNADVTTHTSTHAATHASTHDGNIDHDNVDHDGDDTNDVGKENQIEKHQEHKTLP